MSNRFSQGLHSIINKDGRQFYLFTTANDGGQKGIEIVLTNIQNTWHKKMLPADMKALHKKEPCGLGFGEYCQNTHNMFSGLATVDGQKIEYSVTSNAAEAKLTWKKVSGDIKIILGSVVLAGIEEFPVNRVLEFSIKKIGSQRSHIEQLQSDNERLIQDRETALTRLEKQSAAKEDIEQDLYSKFATIINEKKTKIRQLKQQLEGNGLSASDDANHTTAHASTSVNGKKVGPKKLNIVPKEDSDESDNEYNTDDETSTPSCSVKRKHQSIPDDDLFSSQESPEKSTTVPPRRKRKPQVVKKTPSKPVIPRVMSGDKVPRRGSLRKSSSRGQSSTASSENLDDLIADL